MGSSPDKGIKHLRGLDIAELALKSYAFNAMRDLELNSGLNRVLEDMKRHETIMRAAIGPMEELRRAGIVDRFSILSTELEMVHRAMVDWEARFRLPDMSESIRLMTDLHESLAANAFKKYVDQASIFKNAMEQMRTPWLNTHESIRSIGGFAALQGIGHALNNMPAFGDHLGSALRIDLGDWRDPITWPMDIFTDLGARSDFYVARGFDTALTDFPAKAFEESVNIAGLCNELPELVDLYGFPVPSSNDNEEEGLTRTNTAHDWLLRLETQVRQFVDEEMTKAFGPDWPKHRLPNGLYDQWQEKKRKAQQNGSKEWALMAYADFSDYVPLICRRDNWAVFSPFFSRQEDVREAFQRLHPIRVATMHARPITQDDELLLYVEVRRLVKVMIGRKS